ncbi:RNA polymerase sigma factor [Ruegeria marisrubri]|uniref:RNA polymerase sigma factor n=1 Tax=Ruegeria marisrubri TaxID=1685379 RepID=UPI001CD7FB40|nr:RNA polymerase sigma factor [Ruegeria marisrubri]MCA0908639.1 RNA polymerase sigma factor [Ruegeria marisrubri]
MTRTFDQQLEDALPDLWRFAFSLTRSHDQADDLVQDAVLRAIRKKGLRWPGHPVKPWAMKILLNCFRNDRRRAATRPETDPGALDQLVSPDATAEERLELRWLWRRIDALPEDQKLVLLAVTIAGLTYAETARLLGVPQGTVMSRLSRARTRLQAPEEQAGKSRLRSVT